MKNDDDEFSVSFKLFQTLFLILVKKITEKHKKLTKKVEHNIKVFQPAFECAQHPKAGRNTQQVVLVNYSATRPLDSQYHIILGFVAVLAICKVLRYFLPNNL